MKRRYLLRTSWPAAAALVACQPGALEPAGAGGLGEQLAREVGAQLSLPSFLTYFAALGVIACVLIGLRLVLVSLWRLGFDAERRLSALIPVAKVLSTVLLLVWVAARWSRLSPHLLVVFFPLVAVALLWILAGHVRNLAAGVVLAVTRAVRQGDRIQVGAHAGVVRDVGLARTVLRRADGSRVYVPNQNLLTSELVIARERFTEPVDLVVPLRGRDGTTFLVTARRLALLSPYRALGTATSADWDGATECLHLRLQAWSEEAAELARGSIGMALAKVLEAEPPRLDAES